MQVRRYIPAALAATIISFLFLPLHQLPAQNAGRPSSSAAETEDDNQGNLKAKQDSLTMRYKRFEKTLLQMAEYMRKTDPERADLLIRAIGLSKENRVSQQMEQIVLLMEKQQLGDAIDRQGELVNSLQSLLKLLQSQDRRSEIEKEKERLKDLLKDLGKVIAKEKDVRVETERGGNPKRLADEQGKVEGETRKLADKIDKQDAERNESSEGKSEDKRSDQSSEGEKESSQNKDGGEKNQGKKGKGQKDKEEKSQGEKSGEQKNQESKSKGKKSQGQKSQGEQSQGQKSQGQQQKSSSQKQNGKKSGQQQSGNQQQQNQQRTPGREEIEQARREMERAIEELKKKDHDNASKHQDEALAKLQKAKEKLEEILRQLREEERELLLAALELRFQKMLAMQLAVYNGTVGIHKVPEEERANRHTTRAIKLARDEEQIALEAEKALVLLKEEGTSVAFPEAVEQMRDDILLITRRLERVQVGKLTQTIERDIIEALEEMIEALQQEMEKSRQQQQQQQQQGQQQSPALINQLAELKMLRSLQMRINRRTKRLGQMIQGEQATDPDIVEQLQELAKRQESIQESTYNLATGRNGGGR